MPDHWLVLPYNINTNLYMYSINSLYVMKHEEKWDVIQALILFYLYIELNNNQRHNFLEDKEASNKHKPDLHMKNQPSKIISIQEQKKKFARSFVSLSSICYQNVNFCLILQLFFFSFGSTLGTHISTHQIQPLFLTDTKGCLIA